MKLVQLNNMRARIFFRDSAIAKLPQGDNSTFNLKWTIYFASYLLSQTSLTQKGDVYPYVLMVSDNYDTMYTINSSSEYLMLNSRRKLQTQVFYLWNWRRPMWLCPHRVLWGGVLQEYVVLGLLLWATWSQYNQSESCVCKFSTKLNTLPVGVGLSQGCPQSCSWQWWTGLQGTAVVRRVSSWETLNCISAFWGWCGSAGIFGPWPRAGTGADCSWVWSGRDEITSFVINQNC